MQSQLYRNSRGSRIFDAIIIFVLAVSAAVMLYPLIYVVVTSISTAGIPNRYLYLVPERPHLSAYRLVLRNPMFLRAFANSAFYTVAGSALSIALTMLTAYPLSIRTFPLRNFWMFFIVFTMLFSGGLIPYYLLVRDLHMINTIWAMIIPGSLSAFNVVLARTYLQANIPGEIREAAKVDGAGEWTILLRIVLPLSLPIVAVVGLFSAVGIWNSYINALLFLNDTNLFPIAMILRNIVVGASMREMVPAELRTTTSSTAVQAATLVLAILPITCIYPFLQRYFVKGVMIGALKG